MMICDSQVHIWAANTPERPWPARAEPHRAPLGKEELLAEMDKAGVDRVMIVPPSWEGDRNDVAIDACRSHPDRFAIMGRFDPDAPNARETIKNWKKQPGMLGMRLTFHTPVLRQPLLDGKLTGCGARWRRSAFRRWCCSITSTCTSPTRWPSAIPACGWYSIISA